MSSKQKKINHSLKASDGLFHQRKTEYCDSCGKKVVKPNYISLVREDKHYCRECHTPSFSTDGLLTRTSQRVQDQRRNFAADLVQPHIYDGHKRQQVINPDFVKLYPDKMRYYETPDNMRKQGYASLASMSEKLNKVSKQVMDTPPEMVGSDTKVVKKALKK